jgi:hypothetical protein
MRAMILAVCLMTGPALAQTLPPTRDSPNPTGRTIIPEKKEQGQPSGNSGTADPSVTNPQGETPLRARPAPEVPSKQTK